MPAPTVHLHVDGCSYAPLEVPFGCTVGQWRRLLEEGLLGERMLYTARLVCSAGDSGEEPLHDLAPLPAPPDTLHVTGQRSIVKSLQMALNKKLGAPKPRQDASPPGPRGGSRRPSEYPLSADYRVCHAIGRGFEGNVYLALHRKLGTRAALKFPARAQEVAVLEALNRQAPPCRLGIPRVLEAGTHLGKAFLLTEVFGHQLTRLFERIRPKPLQARWYGLCIVGRLLVRRLEHLHGRGFVHCDISPGNILVGHARDGLTHGSPEGGAPPPTAALPHLVDFGLARAYPGGRCLQKGLSSQEWSSIRSARGGVWRPEDDLEALGWVLLHGLLGDLPWFEWLGEAYKDWRRQDVRDRAVERVREAKSRLLHADEASLEPGWERFATMVPDLREFLLECQAEVQPPERPRYRHLIGFLGGDCELEDKEAEDSDRREYWEHVLPLL